METRQRKRLTELSETEELQPQLDVNPNTAMSDTIQEGNQSLVLDIVIRSLNCPSLLRKCRLVCKTWNESACARLKSVTTTTVTTNPVGLNETRSFASLEQLKSGGALPNPFRKVSLITDMRREQFFNNFNKYLGRDRLLTELTLKGGILILPPMKANLVERRSYIELEKAIFPLLKMNLMSILKSQSRSLQVLRIRDFRVDESERVCLEFQEDLEKIPFPNLKEMQCDVQNKLTNVGKVLIQTIVRHSKLAVLQLNCHGLHQLEDFFKGIKFDNVAKFQLTISTIFGYSEPIKSPDLIRVFASKPWPTLVRLHISADTKQDVIEIVSWLKDSLEVLHINDVKIPLDRLPKCPKLREIRSECGYKGQLVPEKFPALKELYSRGKPPLSDLANMVPHYGVVQAEIELHQTGLPHEDSRICHFCNEWKTWEEDFPQLQTYFQEHQKPFCKVSTALRTINKTFPNLKTLSIVTYSYLTIVPNNTFSKRYREEEILKLPLDLFMQEIFPFQDFLELESLSLSGIEVTPWLIISSLSKIPKLKYLRIDEYKKLTSEIVREYLGHLKEIAILDCNSNYYQSRLAKNERDLMGEIKIPVIKIFCACGSCKNPLWCCQDCHRYT